MFTLPSRAPSTGKKTKKPPPLHDITPVVVLAARRQRMGADHRLAVSARQNHRGEEATGYFAF